MKTVTPPPRLTTWSACSQLAELALLIDALPTEFRGHLVEAALRMDDSHTNESYLVGELRSLVFDCVTQLYGKAVASSLYGDRPDSVRVEIPSSLRDSIDTATMQLAVCDLVEDLAMSLVVDTRELNDES